MRCSICLDSDEDFGVLACGHVFGLACIERHFESREDREEEPNCPKCRVLVNPSDVRRIFLDSDSNDDAGDMTPEEEVKTMTSQLETMKNVVHMAEHVDGDSTVQELEQLVQRGERIAVVSQTLRGEYATALARLNSTLGSLRGRLKYADRLRTRDAELASAIGTINMRAIEVEKLVTENVQLAQDAEDAKKEARTSRRWCKLWECKYHRLGGTFEGANLHHETVQTCQKRKIVDLEEEIDDQRQKIRKLESQVEAQQSRVIKNLPSSPSRRERSRQRTRILPGSFPVTRGNNGETPDAEMRDLEDDVFTAPRAGDAGGVGVGDSGAARSSLMPESLQALGSSALRTTGEAVSPHRRGLLRSLFTFSIGLSRH